MWLDKAMRPNGVIDYPYKSVHVAILARLGVDEDTNAYHAKLHVRSFLVQKVRSHCGISEWSPDRFHVPRGPNLMKGKTTATAENDLLELIDMLDDVGGMIANE